MNTTNEFESTRKKIKAFNLQIQKIEQEKQKELHKEIKTIIQSMNTLGITLEDLKAAGVAQQKEAKKRSLFSKKLPKKSKKIDGRSTVPIRYKNPSTGQTWTGRGKAPTWIQELERQGRSRTEFLLPSPQMNNSNTDKENSHLL